MGHCATSGASGTTVEGIISGPVRTCIACRRTFDKSRLTRFVCMGTRIDVDPGADRPGRGCYVCESPDCLEKALAKDAARLRRALRVGGDHATVEVKAIRAQWPPVTAEQQRTAGAGTGERTGNGRAIREAKNVW